MSVEPPLAKSERVKIQQQLSVLGFYTASIDGDFSFRTRKAIKSFQRASMLESTGYLTDATITLLANKASQREREVVEQQSTLQKAQQDADTNSVLRSSVEDLRDQTARQQVESVSQDQMAVAIPKTAVSTFPTAIPSALAVPSLEPIASLAALKRARVRREPKETAQVIETLDVGGHIDVLGRLAGEDWYLVARDGKPIGYVMISDLEAAPTVASSAPAPTILQQTPSAEPAQAQAQTQTMPTGPDTSRDLTALDYGRYYALVIGNNGYKKLPKLNTAVDDAKAVAATLEREYGFTVSLLTDASEEQMIGALAELRRTLTPNDNLLIFYAGHGWYDDGAERGYWLPVDAVADNQSHWISNADITDSLKAMQAKHVLVVADSCYSGSLTRGLAIGSGSSSYFEDIVKRRARTVLTSGGLEPVLDAGGGGHSVFARAFLDALNANSGVIDGEGIYHKVYDQVRLNAEQEPGYGNIRLAGHDGGDFLFVRKR